jgi:predicted HTH domain antitoxin
MTLTLDIPDEIAASISGAGRNLSRAALEALAVESYGRGELSQAQVGRLLGLSRVQTEDFLAERLALYDYDPTELRREMETLSNLTDSRR